MPQGLCTSSLVAWWTLIMYVSALRVRRARCRVTCRKEKSLQAATALCSFWLPISTVLELQRSKIANFGPREVHTYTYEPTLVNPMKAGFDAGGAGFRISACGSAHPAELP